MVQHRRGAPLRAPDQGPHDNAAGGWRMSDSAGNGKADAAATEASLALRVPLAVRARRRPHLALLRNVAAVLDLVEAAPIVVPFLLSPEPARRHGVGAPPWV